MISLETAIRLKDAGVNWDPTLHDFFAIPDRDMDDVLFVISDIQATINSLLGYQVVSFQGASEWALDSILTEEAVWMPREEQLRDILEVELLAMGQIGFLISAGADGYRIVIRLDEQRIEFFDRDASEAYAKGIFYMLKYEPPN